MGFLILGYHLQVSAVQGSASVWPGAGIEALAPRLARTIPTSPDRAPARFYHRELLRLLRLHVPPGARVLQIACGNGDLLAGVEPAYGVGLESHHERLAQARRRHPHPHLAFMAAEPDAFRLDETPDGRSSAAEALPDGRGSAEETFDFVILGDALGEMTDVQACLERVRSVCTPSTRVILTYHSALWEPALKLATRLGLRAPCKEQNWLNTADLENLMSLAGFDVIKRSQEMLMPVAAPGLAALCNRVLARVWPIRHLALVQMIIARTAPDNRHNRDLSCSVIIPTRNERGNIEAAVRRTPVMGRHTEIIFVDGDSSDGTADEIQRVMAACPDRDIRFIAQGDGRGKGDAVRQGFAAARGDVLMILDADLTVPPEDLPKFYHCIASGQAEFVNGTRLVYPMERDAMRTLNQAANWFFSVVFTWLLGQRFRDTLCGTKVLRRRDYEVIAAGRAAFGDLDPFGDFDLIFGAARANLKIREIPIRYRARTYGATNISRFLHGLMLLKMSAVALWKLKLR